MARLAALAIVVLLAACTSNAGTSDSPRAVEVSMTDALRFDPDEITVQAGETIRFVVSNPTPLDHDFVIGDEHEQEHHAAEMAADGDMMHDEDNAMTVAAGETQELIYTFDEAGDLLIGCHVQGHYEAGMIAEIHVEE